MNWDVVIVGIGLALAWFLCGFQAGRWYERGVWEARRDE